MGEEARVGGVPLKTDSYFWKRNWDSVSVFRAPKKEKKDRFQDSPEGVSLRAGRGFGVYEVVSTGSFCPVEEPRFAAMPPGGCGKQRARPSHPLCVLIAHFESPN